ncbi:MAG TPA: aminotransferase class I/II-fold pyridoxal phosphate-dependent enzyme, partial [Proteobacteria bacterium]|nr:aminotransferase class I/II-fold pyridoxal phosphate-dependent enzyme [Pseudomonadota bacterium]
MKRWRIPFFDVKFTSSEIESVLRVLKRGWLSEGREVAAFEQALGDYLGTGYIVATSSATAALYLALLALGMKAGDRVIMPSLTFVSCANVVVRLGGVPVLVDIESVDRPVIDAGEVERYARGARFVIPVHYGGYPAPIKEIRAIARSRGMFVVEDAAHALGASVKG